jgi:hypothetical protein
MRPLALAAAAFVFMTLVLPTAVRATSVVYSYDDCKPGYGFGAWPEHCGPPGLGYSSYETWREALLKQGLSPAPKEQPLPPVAPTFAPTPTPRP